MTDPIPTALIVAVAILVTAWLNQRVGRPVLLRFPSKDKPEETKEVLKEPPTRWALLVAWIRRAIAIGGILLMGWLLAKGCNG